MTDAQQPIDPAEGLVRVDRSDALDGPREVHLSEYWAVVVKRRSLIGVILASSLLTAGLVSFLSRPTYKAVVSLRVEKDKGSVLDVGSASVMPMEFYNPEFLPTQTRLMKSREIAERAVKRLNLVEDEEFNPKKSGVARQVPRKSEEGKVGQILDPATTVAITLQRRVETTPIRGTNIVELSFTAGSPKLAAAVANALADAYIDWNLEAKYQVVGQASQFLGAQIEQLKAEIEDREAKLQAYGRQKDIVSTDPQTNVTLQKLEALNKDYAQAMADRVGKEARYYELQSARADSIAETLSGGLVTQLRNEQAKAERDYSEKLNLYKPEWPAMQQLKAQIDKGRQNLDAVIQETVTKARESARTEYQMAQRREESLRNVMSQQKSEAMTLNANAVEFNNLRLEATTKRTLLDTLLKRQSETEVMSRLRGSRESSIRVVDRALPPVSRYSPSYRKNGLLALFLGLAGGIGLAFFLEYLDRSIRTPEQVEDILRLPSLGVIPAIGAAARSAYGVGLGKVYGLARSGYGLKGGGKGYGYGVGFGVKKGKKAEAASVSTPEETIEMMPHLHPRSVVAEAYRAVRNALLLSRAGGVKTIVVTSGLPREGKTTTALNLAVVLGQLGKKVVLIDGDLHKPRLHEAMRLPNRIGLVSVLAEGVDAQKALQRTEIPGVFVMTSGPSTPNPSALLTSTAMAALLSSAREGFDYVVVDSPPVLLVSDAMVLGHECDGVILCLKGGVTPREEVIHARDRLRRSSAEILGVVINSLPERTSAYGSGKYGYSYRSAYESAYGDKPAEMESTPKTNATGA